ncbi:hypothetical protein HDU80_005164 [Chytriomyces hyalinus]|nr:hypothetical protein HDU80_005164 [Chytriomyces hyalinus]
MNQTQPRTPDPLFQGFASTQVFYIALATGFALEVFVSCFILNIMRRRSNVKHYVLPSLLGIVNLSGFLFLSSQLISLFLDERYCVWTSVFSNCTSHVFAVGCDAFLLSVALVLSNNDANVFKISCVVLIHKLAWSASDIFMSGGVWDREAHACIYLQNHTTGVGSNVGDLLADLFSTFVVAVLVVKKMDVKSNMSAGLMERNGTRSAVVTVLVIVASYGEVYITDQVALNFVYILQAYIMGRCINYDLYFSQDLATRLEKTSTIQMVLSMSRKSHNPTVSASRSLAMLHGEPVPLRRAVKAESRVLQPSVEEL